MDVEVVLHNTALPGLRFLALPRSTRRMQAIGETRPTSNGLQPLLRGYPIAYSPRYEQCRDIRHHGKEC